MPSLLRNRFFKHTVFILLSLFILVTSLFLYKAIELDLFVRPKLSAGELTREQKIEDARYFFRLIKDSYPFVEAIVHEKGLKNFYDLEEEYIQKIAHSQSNEEFIQLIGELVQLLEQGTAHCDIIYPFDSISTYQSWFNSLTFDVSKKGFYLQEYWWQKLDKYSLSTHSGIETKYENGKYKVLQPYDSIIPIDAVIRKIDDLPVDEYVSTLQTQGWLRFDQNLRKVFSHHSPFLFKGYDREKWKVEFILPDSTTKTLLVPKNAGNKPSPLIEYPKSNVVICELGRKTAYIKIGAFLGYQQRKEDFQIIESFLSKSNREYKKLIIDIRGNTGGSPSYWQDIFVNRLIQKPITHIQYSVVKRKVFEQLNFHNRLYKLSHRFIIDLGQMKKIDWENAPEVGFPDYMDKNDYYLLRNTKVYKPKSPFPFQGKIYLIVDNDTFSAAEDFAKTMKELDLAEVIGVNTLGGAAVSFVPWIFELPNSHIQMVMEIDMAFNQDGSINEIYGTTPDQTFSTSSYPTSSPKSFDKLGLSIDPWIKWILER